MSKSPSLNARNKGNLRYGTKGTFKKSQGHKRSTTVLVEQKSKNSQSQESYGDDFESQNKTPRNYRIDTKHR